MLHSERGTGSKSEDCTEILRGLLRLRIVILIQKYAYPCKSRCRISSHSTRMMLGRYICQRIRFADCFIESVVAESSEEYLSLALPTCLSNSFNACVCS